MRRIILGIGSLILIGSPILGGCGRTGDGPDEASAGSLVAFVELLSPYSADYDPAGSPQELAERSDVVVTGQFRDAIAGRSLVLNEDPLIEDGYALLVLEIQKVESGTVEGDSSTVYIEIPFAGDMRELSEAIPKDRTVRAYLSLRNESGSPRASRKDPVDVVYIPTTPQGLLVDDGSGNVVQPIEHGSRFGGTNLSDFLPDDVGFPEYDPNAPHEE
ncbi:MAG TPA: hypothetical protein VIR58_10690 [Acidimicrobiales bacterium]